MSLTKAEILAAAACADVYPAGHGYKFAWDGEYVDGNVVPVNLENG